MNEDTVRAQLREALAAHRPDRTAMLNKIAANRAEEPRPRGRTLRLAGAALAVTTVLGLGGVVRWALAEEERPSASAPAAPATPSPSTAASPAGRPSASVPPRPRSTAPSPSPVRGHPGDTKVEKGSLRSEASLGDDGATVTLHAGADLTQLDLTVRVVRTGELAAGGTSNSAPDGAVSGTVERRADALLYRFTLRDGATLRAGTYDFTVRYTYEGNRRDDTYEAYAFSVERKVIHVYGNFFPRD